MNKNFIHNFKESVFHKRLINSTMLLVLVVPSISIAAALANPLKTDSFAVLIGAILTIMVSLGTPIAVLFLVYAGFLFVTASGDPKKLETARSAFIWTCVGTALIVGANVVMLVLEGTVKSLQ